MIVKKLILHCSASDNPFQDDIASVRSLHTAPKDKHFKWGEYRTNGKAWSNVGYHFFIQTDGTLEFGRPDNIQGAHCFGQNHDSLGICLSGSKNFTEEQKKQCKALLKHLCEKHHLGNAQIFGHCHFNKSKTCPNFDIKEVLPF